MTGLICCTLDCNLACSYCYEGNGKKCEHPDRNRINSKFREAKPLIIDYLDQLYEYNQKTLTRVIWHGGEPTLIDSALLDEIMQDQKDKGHEFMWAIQSNGTLITEQYADVLSKYNMSIGVSIDGMKAQHDRYRVFKNGNPTFDVIMKNVDLLQSKGINCGALITITDNNIDYLIEIYDLFAQKNLNFNFNALFPNDNGEVVELDSIKYADKICELFDYWIEDEAHHITISPFMQIIEAFVGTKFRVPACHWSKNCSDSFSAINTDGDLYPCEHWVGIKNFRFGNIRNGLENELKKNQYFTNRYCALKDSECQDCEIWELCYGGCPWNAYELFGSVNKKDSSICTGRKAIIRHIREVLQKNGKIK